MIDAFVSFKDKTPFEFEGRTYWGRYYQEHQPGRSTEAIERLVWLRS